MAHFYSTPFPVLYTQTPRVVLKELDAYIPVLEAEEEMRLTAAAQYPGLPPDKQKAHWDSLKQQANQGQPRPPAMRLPADPQLRLQALQAMGITARIVDMPAIKPSD